MAILNSLKGRAIGATKSNQRQSASSIRRAAALSGLRPERYLDPRRFDTMPS